MTIRFRVQAPALGNTGVIVEVDETYVGAKADNNMHKGAKRQPKMIVMALNERGGEVRAVPDGDAHSSTFHGVIKAHVSETAHLMTDSAIQYPGI